MKRFGLVLAIVALLSPACGGRSQEPVNESDGLAALQTTSPDAGANGTKDKAKPKAPDKGKDAGGAKKKRPSGSASRGDDSNGDSTAGSDGPAPAPGGGGKKAAQPAQAAAAVPVPAGTHSYDTDGTTTVSGNSRRMPKRTTLAARPPSNGRQVQIRDLRDSDGNGTVVETHLVYREEGVYLTYVKITATFPGGFTDVRELQPSKPELIAPTGAEPGAKAAFTLRGSGTRADVDVAAKRFEDVTVGGAKARTLVVDTKIVFSGAIEGQQTSTSWFWGKHVLAVREAVATDVSNGPIRVQSQYQAVLTRLP